MRKTNSQDEPFIKPKKTFKKNQIKGKTNYTSPNKYELLLIDDRDDDSNNIRDAHNKNNKEYNQGESTGGNNEHNESVLKVKKRVVILGDSIVKNVNGLQL